MKIAKLAFAILVWSCLQPDCAFACRYNVRDVGFVDLETEPYHFYGYVRKNTPTEVVSLLKNSTAEALRDSNVNVEIVNVDEQKQHEALKYLPANSTSALLAGVLVSPDGQALPLTLARPGQLLPQSLAAALGEIVSSPMREKIVQTVSQTYGAVLLIEGDDAAANSRARKTILDAIDQIRAQMKGLPKTIAEPPVMLVLDAASLAREKILLWSLRSTTEKAGAPRAAVLYGKARWIGPMMNGAEITERNLSGIFSILGADCECGLDISWTQGTRLPVRWDDNLHARVAKALGFDPENPLVKFEVSRIVGSRGSAAVSAARQSAASPEGPAKLVGGKTPAMSAPAKVTAATHPSRVPNAAQPMIAENAPVLRSSLILLGGLTIIVLSAGAWIIFRAEKRRRQE